jgi:micrococcal nuclease
MRRLDAVTSAVVALVALVSLICAVVALSVVALWGSSPTSIDAQPVRGPEPGVSVKVIQATFVKVVDGDSVLFRMGDGTVEKVRMIGIDAPEMGDANERYAVESRQFAHKLLSVKPTVYLEKGIKERDRYGQLLAYVWLSRPSERPSTDEVRAKMLNARMVLGGYARDYPSTPGVAHANVKYSSLLDLCVAEARERQRGAWGPSFEQ